MSNKDILDLCRLNLMEENADSEEIIKVIEWKKKRLVEKIIASSEPATQSVLDKHIKQNTVNDIYPWTDA